MKICICFDYVYDNKLVKVFEYKKLEINSDCMTICYAIVEMSYLSHGLLQGSISYLDKDNLFCNTDKILKKVVKTYLLRHTKHAKSIKSTSAITHTYYSLYILYK